MLRQVLRKPINGQDVHGPLFCLNFQGNFSSLKISNGILSSSTDKILQESFDTSEVTSSITSGSEIVFIRAASKAAELAWGLEIRVLAIPLSSREEES